MTLQNIHRGRKHLPPRLLVYGTEGIGKTTLAAAAPSPIFIPTEDGLDQIDCASFPLAKNFADVENALRSLIHEKHEFETVVIDSCDWAERFQACWPGFGLQMMLSIRILALGTWRSMARWSVCPSISIRLIRMFVFLLNLVSLFCFSFVFFICVLPF
ncbi:MAG: ATP-binding protein [Phycisphaerales bacterium]|nr:ATP-binding protein [Phycisphaerales bacterium]